MGFRNAEEARAHRMRALETELEERDREIAMLRAKLEQREEPGEVEEPENDDGEVASAPLEWTPEEAYAALDVPEGDVGVLDLAEPLWKAFVIVQIGVMVAVVVFALLKGTRPEPWHFLLGLPLGLLFLNGERLTLDRVAGTVTQTQWVLFIRRSRTIPCAGESVEVGPEHVFIGEMLLFSVDTRGGKEMAQRIANFLQIPCVESERRQGPSGLSVWLSNHPNVLPLLSVLVCVALLLVWALS